WIGARPHRSERHPPNGLTLSNRREQRPATTLMLRVRPNGQAHLLSAEDIRVRAEALCRARAERPSKSACRFERVVRRHALGAIAGNGAVLLPVAAHWARRSGGGSQAHISTLARRTRALSSCSRAAG